MKQTKVTSFEEFMRRLRNGDSVGNGGTVSVKFNGLSVGGVMPDVLNFSIQVEAIVDHELLLYIIPFYSDDKDEFACVVHDATEQARSMSDAIVKAGFLVGAPDGLNDPSAAAVLAVESITALTRFMPPQARRGVEAMMFGLLSTYAGALADAGGIVNMGADNAYFISLQEKISADMVNEARLHMAERGHVN